MKSFYTVIIILFVGGSVLGQDAEVFFKRGENKYNNGHYENAIADYTEAIKLKPDYLNAHLRRAFCYTSMSNYEGAIEDYTKIIELKYNLQWALNSRGSAYLKLKKYDLALKDFNQVLSIDPKDTVALNNRGWVYDGKGDRDRACQDWKKSKKYGNTEAKLILKTNNCK